MFTFVLRQINDFLSPKGAAVTAHQQLVSKVNVYGQKRCCEDKH